MVFEYEVQSLANKFLKRGFGMVAMVGLEEADGEQMYRCFSTVSKRDMFAILDVAATKVAMLPVSEETDEGVFVNRTGDGLDLMASEAAVCLGYHDPMIIGIAGEGRASILVVGNPPELTYMAVRMMGILKSQGFDPTMFRFSCSDN